MLPRLSEYLTEVEIGALTAAIPAAAEVETHYRKHTGFTGPDIRSRQYARERLCETCRGALRARSPETHHRRCRVRDVARPIHDDLSFFRRVDFTRQMVRYASKLDGPKALVLRLCANVRAGCAWLPGRDNALAPLGALLDRGDWRGAEVLLKGLMRLGVRRRNELRTVVRARLDARSVRPVGVALFLSMHFPRLMRDIFVNIPRPGALERAIDVMNRRHFTRRVIELWAERIARDAGETAFARERRLVFVRRFSYVVRAALHLAMNEEPRYPPSTDRLDLERVLLALSSFEYRFSAVTHWGLDGRVFVDGIAKALMCVTLRTGAALDIMDSMPRVAGVCGPVDLLSMAVTLRRIGERDLARYVERHRGAFQRTVTTGLDYVI